MIVSAIVGFIGAMTWVSGIIEEAETKDVYKAESIRIIGVTIMLVAGLIAVAMDIFNEI